MVYKSTIGDPGRFARADDVGSYLGLTPRRYQSGEVDLAGHISKGGDAMLRHALYEAANAVLSRLKRDCALKAWGLRLQQRKGAKRARIAVARKLAVLLHRLWQNETTSAGPRLEASQVPRPASASACRSLTVRGDLVYGAAAKTASGTSKTPLCS